MSGFEWFLLVVVVVLVPLVVAVAVTLWTLEQARQRKRQNRPATDPAAGPVKRKATRDATVPGAAALETAPAAETLVAEMTDDAIATSADEDVLTIDGLEADRVGQLLADDGAGRSFTPATGETTPGGATEGDEPVIQDPGDNDRDIS